jgi:hypothetical protein
MHPTTCASLLSEPAYPHGTVAPGLVELLKNQLAGRLYTDELHHAFALPGERAHLEVPIEVLVRATATDVVRVRIVVVDAQQPVRTYSPNPTRRVAVVRSQTAMNDEARADYLGPAFATAWSIGRGARHGRERDENRRRHDAEETVHPVYAYPQFSGEASSLAPASSAATGC